MWVEDVKKVADAFRDKIVEEFNNGIITSMPHVPKDPSKEDKLRHLDFFLNATMDATVHIFFSTLGENPKLEHMVTDSFKVKIQDRLKNKKKSSIIKP